MKSEQEFDDFIKNKLSDESAFPFEEDKWVRMEEMIIAAEEKKKRRGFFWIFFSGFMTALVLIIPFMWYILTSKDKVEGFSKKDQKLHASIKGSKTVKSKSAKADEDELDDKDQNKNRQFEEQNKITEDKFNSEQKDEVNLNETNHAKKDLISKIKTKNNKKSASFDKLNGSSKSNTGTNNTALEVVKAKEIIIENETLAKEKEIVKEDEKRIQDSINSVIQNDSISQMKNDSIANSITENLEKNKIDTLSSAKKEDEVFEKGFSFYSSLGAQYNLGFSKNDGNSFSPYVSATTKYRFSPVWALISGLGYYQVSNLNFEKQIIQKSYDFGYRDKVTSISQQKLHYLTIPIEISRKWNKSNLGFGINPTILIANKSELSTQEKTSLKETEKISTPSFKHGYGLNTFDLQFSLSYSYDFGKRIAVGTSFSYGVLDVREDSWTETSSAENNKAVRLNLIYKIK